MSIYNLLFNVTMCVCVCVYVQLLNGTLHIQCMSYNVQDGTSIRALCRLVLWPTNMATM